MTNGENINISAYNDFCKNLKEGCILYNVDTTNNWGDYLLVVNKATVRIGEYKTYTALLLGLQKEKDRLVPRNIRIKLTPDYAGNIPFLKYVGQCSFELVPSLTDVSLDIGLATAYGSIDLRKYREKLSIRKPKRRKYGNDGKEVIGKVYNK